MKESIYQKELDSYKINLLKNFIEKNNIKNKAISDLLNDKDFIAKLLLLSEEAKEILKNAISINGVEKSEIDEFYQQNYTVDGLEKQKKKCPNTILYYNLTSGFQNKSEEINRNILNKSFFKISELKEMIAIRPTMN